MYNTNYSLHSADKADIKQGYTEIQWLTDFSGESEHLRVQRN